MLFALVDLNEELDQEVSDDTLDRDVGHHAVHASCAFLRQGLVVLKQAGYQTSHGIRTKPLRTEAPGSKSDKVDKSPWMKFTTRVLK